MKMMNGSCERGCERCTVEDKEHEDGSGDESADETIKKMERLDGRE